ncbi:hypothetical protein [Plesiomonas shigelloides]|uniref:hypothetical protein n=1 Tax=Plesiomonas shigelloides TaxID=703 RepID=UPI0012624FD7|nr:hypothetical protein [Plesiomonas shigelloides]KAB7661905.1 hypothetical protein GBN25_13935 [Plesiomonas shigelloides]
MTKKTELCSVFLSAFFISPIRMRHEDISRKYHSCFTDASPIFGKSGRLAKADVVQKMATTYSTLVISDIRPPIAY